MPLFALTEDLVFPPPYLAEPEGLLAIGGDLSINRLLLAYRSGIFPWYSPGEPILWWSPDPRFVLFPQRLQVSKSMRQLLRRNVFEISFDRAFAEVIAHCSSAPRPGQSGTWITTEMQAAYIRLHKAGFAHSAEAWQNGVLVGGLYGISLGRVFFGESMFSEVSNASKAAFITLVQWLQVRDFQLIDSQVYTEHLASLGAEEVPRSEYLNLLQQGLSAETLPGPWQR